MTIDQRIKRLEKCKGSETPGTQITRNLAPMQGVGWTLALGGMMQRKQFFVAPTIEACLRCAETELGLRK